VCVLTWSAKTARGSGWSGTRKRCSDLCSARSRDYGEGSFGSFYRAIGKFLLAKRAFPLASGVATAKTEIMHD